MKSVTKIKEQKKKKKMKSGKYFQVNYPESPKIPIIPMINPSHLSNVIFPWGNSNFNKEITNNLPNYFRSVTQAIPSSPDIAAISKIPLALVIEPGNVSNVPLFDFSQSHIPRCNKCEGYLSCFCSLSSNKREWVCGLCGSKNKFEGDVNVDFLQNHLTNSVYDMQAPFEYVQKSQIMKSFCFIIDISYEAVSTGFTKQFIESIKTSLTTLADNTCITIICCGNFASIYDVYSMREHVILEPNDFIATANFICWKKDKIENILAILDLIAKKEPSGRGNCFGSALTVASSALRVYGGVIVASCCACPSLGPYALTQRITIPQNGFSPINLNDISNNQNDSNLPSEVSLFHLSSIDDSGTKYRKLALKMNQRAISLHLFTLPHDHIELPVAALACGLTGGRCFYYRELDPAQLHSDIFLTLSDKYRWHCSMKLRCSDGIVIDKTYGNVINHNDTLMFPVLASKSTLTFGLQVTKPITKAIFQAALLWTHSPSKRYIRVMNFSIPVSSENSVITHQIDEIALSALFIKSAAVSILNFGGQRTSNDLEALLRNIVKRGANFHSFYHIIHGLVNHPLLKYRSPYLTDRRMADILNIRIMSAVECALTVYPKLVNIETKETLPLRAENIENGVFALMDSYKIVVWGSKGEKEEIAKSLFTDDLMTPKDELGTITNQMMEITQHYMNVKYMTSEEGYKYALQRMVDNNPNVQNFDEWIQRVAI